MTALGLRQNNPGNLRPDPAHPWLGEIPSPNDYCCFNTPENGLRAMGKNILTAVYKHGCNTITRLITRWAPPNENDTVAYIKAVAGDVGVDADAPLDVTNGSVMSSLLMAITRHENGEIYYSVLIFERAASLVVGDGLEW